MKKIIKEFREFAMKGNVLDMAIGVIIGSAFGKIVTSLVNDIFMPLIGVITGGVNFAGLSVKVGESTVAYGNFIQNVIDFLIVAVCIFTMVKALNTVMDKLRKEKQEEKKEEEKEEEEKDNAYKEILTEIRDLLKEK